MTEATRDDQRAGGVLSAISSAVVTLHKEQFGRGPTRARTNFAGDDTLVCVLEDALLPAERVMVQMGEQQRVRESRGALQAATSDQFVGAVERILGREVTAFASAIDPDRGVVWEVFNLGRADAHGDGGRPSLPSSPASARGRSVEPRLAG
jgi:uncharacterized protein YbcI